MLQWSLRRADCARFDRAESDPISLAPVWPFRPVWTRPASVVSVFSGRSGNRSRFTLATMRSWAPLDAPGEIFRTEQAFFRGHHQEEHRALQLRAVSLQLLRGTDQRGNIRRIIERAVIDLVAIPRFADSVAIRCAKSPRRDASAGPARQHADDVVARETPPRTSSWRAASPAVRNSAAACLRRRFISLIGVARSGEHNSANAGLAELTPDPAPAVGGDPASVIATEYDTGQRGGSGPVAISTLSTPAIPGRAVAFPRRIRTRILLA